MQAVFKGYDQCALDREYDNRAKVGDRLGEYLSFYATESLTARAALPASLNISYGSSGAETMDIFPAESGASQPVQIFIHGGYWKALDSKDFSFVVRAFRPKGVLTVVLNYGLMPGITMGELVDQCRRAVAWVHRNITEYGGDPGKIYISGHSAGGHLAAMMLMTDWAAHGIPEDPIKGAVGISGLYDLEPVKQCFINEELELSEDDVAQFSPVRHSLVIPAPFLLTVGAKEGPEYLRQSTEMANAWVAKGVKAEAVPMAGHDHFSIIQQLNDPDSALARLICSQMNNRIERGG